MKKANFIFAVLFCFPFISHSQFNPPNFLFYEFETIQCPFDSSVTIQQPKNWRIYQTLNNKWDGTVDSNSCINVIDSASIESGFDLGTIDPTRSIFIKCLITSQILLNPNEAYAARSLIGLRSPLEPDISTTCPNNLCSGLIIGIEIPDSNFTGTTMRYYFDIPNNLTGNSFQEYFETCIPTEYFNQNYLREFIIKITLDAPSIDLNGEYLELFNVFFEDYNYGETVSEIIAPYFNGIDSTYFVPIQETTNENGWWADYYLMLYGDDTTYPSSNNIYYIEGRPEPNTDYSAEVNLIVEEQFSLLFQPYTALRGALVEGSDTLRHSVNLINNGNDLCLSQIIDFTFDNGSNFLFRGGNINFEGKSACLMFKNKSALVVGENHTLHYGQNGKGILALQPGGEIILEKNSELIIDNTLWLQGFLSEKYEPQFYIDLQPSMTLTFGENAEILNLLSHSRNTKLNVYMNGGTLNDSKLSASSRNLINRIYPKPAERFMDNITIYQNPASSELTFGFLADEAGILELELFDMNGRIISFENYNVQKGHSKNSHSLDNLPTGIYVLKLKIRQQSAALKIFKI